MADINNCGYYTYLGSPNPPEEPRVLTRLEKGQALTHLEMDVNLASLLHTIETSSSGSVLAENTEEQDLFFERRKPTREEEMEGLFATFSYAPIQHGEGDEESEEEQQPLVQYDPIVVKVQHTTDEIRYKLSNEQIPGTLDVQEDLHVTGSVYAQNLFATESLRVHGSSSFDGDVYIVGNLYVNGVMFGNLDQQAYHPTVESRNTYAEPYERQHEIIPRGAKGGAEVGEPPTYYTQEQVDQMLQNLRDELLREIHGEEK